MVKLIRKISIIASISSLVYMLPVFTVIHAKDKSKDWHFSKSIDLPDNNKYQSFFLDEEVYAGADENLNDLRIVNSKGQFVPFYIESGYKESKEQNIVYSSTLVNTARKDQNTVLDFRITPIKENEDIQGNTLLIDLPNIDFLKHVEVYGSYDGNQWEYIKKNDLYRTDRLENKMINLGTVHKYSFYRLKVLDNVENLIFKQLQLVHKTYDFKWSDYKKTSKPTFNIKEDSKLTDITIQNKNRLKIKTIMFDVDNNFTRAYSVYDPKDNEIQVDGKNEIYHINFKNVQINNTTITAVTPITQPYFTIKINNDDNPPLDIKGIKVEYFLDKIIFEDQGTGPYKLLYGNDHVEAPKYDIENFKQYIQKENLALGKLKGQMIVSPITDSKKPRWFQTKIWFNAIIIAVSLVLIVFLTIKMSRPKK
ncbi:hypothetical protein V7146_24275 [Gottfriedia acidiceleris]|uniref:hypothetical protein n=1 Tax=Gottfriedia acidiceleris TaxID=371036 RepID=UPI002FFE89D5